MVLKALGLILAAWSLSAAARKSLSTLVDDCKFAINNREYNLCPLFDRNPNEWKIEVETDTPPTLTRHVYRIALDGALKKDGTLPEHEQCPDGTWICMTVSNRRPEHRSEPPRTIQLVPIAGNLPSNSDSSSSTVNVTAYHGTKNGVDVLEVRLHGGNYAKQPQYARFQFYCDENVQEPSTPSFTWSWNGSHTFSWSTLHACGNLIAYQSEPSDNGDMESDPPPQEDTPESDDLVGSLPAKSTGRMFTVIFIFTTSGILLIGYLIYSPPYRLKQWLMSHLVKSKRSQLPFRVGESILIRWAEEDMGIDDDEDLMVNYREDSDSDEQIPLKPSPTRFSSRLVNYGSAMN